jgi:hypothetical protein
MSEDKKKKENKKPSLGDRMMFEFMKHGEAATRPGIGNWRQAQRDKEVGRAARVTEEFKQGNPYGAPIAGGSRLPSEKKKDKKK